MRTKHLKNAAIYFFSAAMSVLLIWYVLYHLFSASDKEITTTPAVIATKSNSVLLDGYIVRDESVLYASSEGGVNYLFDDGERIAANTVIANIYSGAGAAEVSDKILAIDKKVSILENSSVSDKATKVDTNILDGKINEIFYLMRDKLEDGDMEYALYRKDELLTYLNKRQVITQNIDGFEDQIISLIRERETLSGQLINLEENITSSVPGYFYSQIDGYEEIFTPTVLKELTLDGFYKLVDSDPVDYSQSLTVGKLVNSTEWYVVSEISSEDVKKFAEGNTYDVVFPFNSDKVINMTVDRIIKERGKESSVLVFKTNYTPEDFHYFRKQNVQIIDESYTGYKIPANAVRVVDGVKGVYVLAGNTVGFREIEVLTEQDGYFIVKEQPTYLEDEFYYKKLGLYDLVITSGKNLYDGKIISVSGVDS